MAELPPADDLSASERRLVEHLALLRADPPRADGELVARVTRTARWQRAVRAPLRAVAVVAASVVDGLALLVGDRRRG
jgi:hypothetical protein